MSRLDDASASRDFAAIDEEAGRRAHPAVEAAALLLAHALQIHLIVRFRGVTGHVQPEPRGQHRCGSAAIWHLEVDLGHPELRAFDSDREIECEHE